MYLYNNQIFFQGLNWDMNFIVSNPKNSLYRTNYVHIVKANPGLLRVGILMKPERKYPTAYVKYINVLFV